MRFLEWLKISRSDHRSSGIRFESLEENDEKKEQEKIKYIS